MIDQNLLLCWGAIHRKVEKGQTIFYEGDEGKEFIQGLFGPGESFGLRVETVIRTIRGMYQKGVLALEKGKVYV